MIDWFSKSGPYSNRCRLCFEYYAAKTYAILRDFNPQTAMLYFFFTYFQKWSMPPTDMQKTKMAYTRP